MNNRLLSIVNNDVMWGLSSAMTFITKINLARRIEKDSVFAVKTRSHGRKSEIPGYMVVCIANALSMFYRRSLRIPEGKGDRMSLPLWPRKK